MTVVKRPSGFGAFTVMWAGQLLSALGTRMTNFALSIWVWQQTGSATDLSLMMFFAFGATVLFSPIAGSLVDRWSRRLTIVLSDVGSAVATFALLAMFLTGDVQLWQLYVVNLATGAFLAFQAPAYSSAITVMMDKGRYTRANAMMWAVRTLPVIFAPAFAATLLGFTGVKLILLLDGLSFVIAIGAVFLVSIPAIPKADGPRASLWSDSVYGFKYILARPGLVGLEIVLFTIGLFAAIGFAMLVPLVLARTGGSEASMGVVQSVGAFGGVLGGVLLGALKPPKKKITWVLTAILGFSILGRVVYGVGDSVVAWSAGLFFTHLFIPFIDGVGQTIWQEKVAPAVQGRVFAARQFLENLAIPIGLLVAGPVADTVFEPAMREGGPLADEFGWLVGTGPGAGMGLLCVLVGVLGIALAAWGFASRTIRDVEIDLPDHDATDGPIAASAAVPTDDAVQATADHPQPAAKTAVPVND
ncbi:MFS transporter [Actinosynnema sp. NPDC020468]|uniref:MFS transporter n=1 Tax=Actinosynnema sp. NPDC020468 TaxID=3154488 RepID=UPI0033E7AF1D